MKRHELSLFERAKIIVAALDDEFGIPIAKKLKKNSIRKQTPREVKKRALCFEYGVPHDFYKKKEIKARFENKKANVEITDLESSAMLSFDDVSFGSHGGTGDDFSSSSRSYVPPTPYEKRTNSMLDDESENEEGEQRQPVNKRKRVGFHDSTRDNEGATREKYPDAATVTLATPLSEHVAVDQKLSLVVNSCSNTMAAFPNQPNPIITPSRIVYENWQRNVTNGNIDEEFEEDVIEILQQFRYNYRNKSQKLKLHLVIKDSLLFPTNFTKKCKQCLEIDAKYPQKMEGIIAAMENEISVRKNDYFIKNVIFSMGFDLLCYEPNSENAIKNLLYFLRNFVEVLRAAFDDSGPKRFKSMSTDSIPIQIPKLIILTIPFIDSHPFATTFKHQIMAMNEALRKYVKENEEKLSKRYNQSIEIYDWEKEAHAYDKCNRADFESRFKILTTALSEKHQMFIVKQEPNSHGYEQNDSNEYDSQDYDSEELQG